MFASIQSTLRSGKDFRPDPAAARGDRGGARRREEPAEVMKSVDEVIGQLADLEKRGEHSTAQIKRNLEASTATLSEMWDEEWTQLVTVLIKMCLESDEAVFVVDLLPIFMKYTDFVDLFRERLMGVASEFVLPSGSEDLPANLEQVPAFLGSLLCARWPRGLHRDTQESNPILFTAFEIVRGWVMVVEEATEKIVLQKRRERATAEPAAAGEPPKEGVESVREALEAGCTIADEEEEEREEEETAESAAAARDLLNRCCSALAAICETQQRSLWLSRPELVDDMYKCIKVAITHNGDVEGRVKVALLHTFLLMNEWTRSKAVTTKCAATQTAAAAAP